MCSQLRFSSQLSAQLHQGSNTDPYEVLGHTGRLSEGHGGRMEPLHPKPGRFAQCEYIFLYVMFLIHIALYLCYFIFIYEYLGICLQLSSQTPNPRIKIHFCEVGR